MNETAHHSSDTGFNVDYSENLFDTDSDNQSCSSVDWNVNEEINDIASDSKTKIGSVEENILPEDSFLLSELRKCCLKHHVTRDFVDELLGILGKYWDLPKDARTLLKTPASMEVKNFPDGDYAHFGIRTGIEENLKACQFQNISSLSLFFNIDDLPLFKSSPYQFWPILCIIKEINSKPFIVGIFYGRTKPTNISVYLKEFISDLKKVL